MSVKKHTPETIEKIRQARLGKKHSEATRRAIAESQKESWAKRKQIKKDADAVPVTA